MMKTEAIGPEAGRSSATPLEPDRYTTFQLPEASNGAFRTCRVLQYYADGMHHAHELSMDLVGSADSPQDALDRLRIVVADQIAYARAAEGDTDALLDFPAPPDLQRRAKQAQTQLRSVPAGNALASPRLTGGAADAGSVHQAVGSVRSDV